MKKVTKEVIAKDKKMSTNFMLGVLATSIILLAIVVGMLGTNLDNRSDAKGNKGGDGSFGRGQVKQEKPLTDKEKKKLRQGSIDKGVVLPQDKPLTDREKKLLEQQQQNPFAR